MPTSSFFNKNPDPEHISDLDTLMAEAEEVAVGVIDDANAAAESANMALTYRNDAQAAATASNADAADALASKNSAEAAAATTESNKDASAASALSASNSATTATSASTTASASATASGASASQAAASASAASGSASTAEGHKNAAATSETNAASSASSASTSASNAATSEANALAYKNAAAASETNAASSASSALASENAAATSETNAASSASSALASENAAATSETNAASSAAAAATFNPALYVKLTGANAFDTRPTFNGGIPWDSKNLRRDYVSLVGVVSSQWSVPSGAKYMRLRGVVKTANSNAQYPLLRAGFGGTILSASPDYTTFGRLWYNNTGWSLMSAANFTGALFAPAHVATSVDFSFEATAALTRNSTSDQFSIDTSGRSWDNAVGAQSGELCSLVAPASIPGSVLAITDFAIVNAGTPSNWAAGSHLWVEWYD